MVLLTCLGWEEKRDPISGIWAGQYVFYNLLKILKNTSGKKSLLIKLLYEEW
jgi:hypothetical protein